MTRPHLRRWAVVLIPPSRAQGVNDGTPTHLVAAFTEAGAWRKATRVRSTWWGVEQVEADGGWVEVRSRGDLRTVEEFLDAELGYLGGGGPLLRTLVEADRREASIARHPSRRGHR